MPNRILITGSSGYIGSHLFPKIIQLWPTAAISVCDAKEGQDYTQVSNQEFDIVFHLGAMSIIGGSFGTADKIMQVNALGLIPFLSNNRIGKMIFSSSGSVYGERNDPAREDYIYWGDCVSPYAQSKYLAENIIRRMHKNYFIARFGNVFGGRMRESLALSHFQKDNPIVVYGGRQIRDFIHVDLICDALIAAATRNIQGTYNLAHGQSTPIAEIAEEFGRKRNIPVIYEEARKEDVVNTKLDASRAKNLGLIPKEMPDYDYYKIAS